MKPITFIKFVLLALCMAGMIIGCDKDSVAIMPDTAPGIEQTSDVDNSRPTYFGHDDTPTPDDPIAITGDLVITLRYTSDLPGELYGTLEIYGEGRGSVKGQDDAEISLSMTYNPMEGGGRIMITCDDGSNLIIEVSEVLNIANSVKIGYASGYAFETEVLYASDSLSQNYSELNGGKLILPIDQASNDGTIMPGRLILNVKPNEG